MLHYHPEEGRVRVLAQEVHCDAVDAGQDDGVEARHVKEPVAAGQSVARHLIKVVVVSILGGIEPRQDGLVGVDDALGPLGVGGRGEWHVNGVPVPDRVALGRRTLAVVVQKVTETESG